MDKFNKRKQEKNSLDSFRELSIIISNYQAIFWKGKLFRSGKDSNLRGQSPIDFESIALTTRPPLLPISVSK